MEIRDFGGIQNFFIDAEYDLNVPNFNHFFLWSIPIHIQNFRKIRSVLLELSQMQTYKRIQKHNLLMDIIMADSYSTEFKTIDSLVGINQLTSCCT